MPGVGCGKAVDIAVWNDMLPSTFCMIWWMWPLSTVTDPKRLSRLNACSESSVPQPQSGYTVHSGTCAKSTIGVLLGETRHVVLQPRDLLGAERARVRRP